MPSSACKKKEMTRKVSAEVDLVHQQTQNQRYGSSHIGATAKYISNVVTDAASGVVFIFHGIAKTVIYTLSLHDALPISSPSDRRLPDGPHRDRQQPAK